MNSFASRQGAHPLTTFGSAAFSELIEVTVGSEPGIRGFHLHKDVLTFYSGWFDRAYKDSFLEGRTGAINLPLADLVTFSLFQYWVYNRRFNAGPSEEITSISFADLCGLWVFGDAYHVPLLQNYALDVLHEKVIHEWVLPLSEIHYVYENTAPGSKLRMYIIDAIACTGNPNAFMTTECESFCCKDALCELVRVIWHADVPKLTKDEYKRLPMCHYHVHEDGVTCGGAGKTESPRVRARSRSRLERVTLQGGY